MLPRMSSSVLVPDSAEEMFCNKLDRKGIGTSRFESVFDYSMPLVHFCTEMSVKYLLFAMFKDRLIVLSYCKMNYSFYCSMYPLYYHTCSHTQNYT